MTFPVNGILDNFNRSDTGPPPSANWTNVPIGGWLPIDGGLRVVSNECANDGGALDTSGSYWSAASFSADQEGYFTFTTLATLDNYGVGIVLRSLPGTDRDGYQIDFVKGGTLTNYMLIVWKILGGFNTSISGFVDLEIAAGDSLGASVIGTTIHVYQKPSGGSWSEVYSVSDSDVNRSGYVGFVIYGSTARADDFGGGTLGRTGDLSQTLGALSLSADGWLERIGDLAQTLGALTLDAQGEALTYQYPILINVRSITASGAGAIGVDVSGHAISQNVRADSLVVEDGGVLEARSVYYDTITTLGTGQIIPLRSDRAVWDVSTYAGRHASDIDASTWVYHRNPALSGSYTVTNPSTRRILDVASTSLNEVAAILGTLIGDLGMT